MKEETCYSSSIEDLTRKAQKDKESILKRIPAGAEATTVLVGTVDFLQEAAIAFVRLAEGIYLPAVTEVRFLIYSIPIVRRPMYEYILYHIILFRCAHFIGYNSCTVHVRSTGTS